MSKHSPGPWRWDETAARFDGEPGLYDANNRCILGHPTAWLVFNRADERLIAAAPEMLAALERLTVTCGECGKYKAHEDYCAVGQLLAKVKGGES